MGYTQDNMDVEMLAYEIMHQSPPNGIESIGSLLYLNNMMFVTRARGTDGSDLAIKFYITEDDLPGDEPSERNLDISQEIRINCAVRDAGVKGVASFHDHGSKNFCRYLIFDYVGDDTFYTGLKKSWEEYNHYPNAIKLQMAKLILEPVSGLHDIGILHLDNKPDNYLVDDRANILLTDFSTSKFANDNLRTTLSTPLSPSHFAPEQSIDGKPLTKFTDVFIAGLCVYEIFFDRRARVGTDPSDVVKTYRDGNLVKPDITSEFEEEGWKMISDMCEYYPIDRITVDDSIVYIDQMMRYLL